MCTSLSKDDDTVWNPIKPQRYTEFLYSPSPTTNNDTTTGTRTTNDAVLTGYLQSFIFFEDDDKEEVLSSFRFRDDVQDEADVFLLPYVTAGTVMVGVHINIDDFDECLGCVIAMNNFFEMIHQFHASKFSHGRR